MLWDTLWTVWVSGLVTWYSWEAFVAFGDMPVATFCYAGAGLFWVMIWVIALFRRGD